MAAIAANITSRIAELSDSAFGAFCEDIGGMFGVEIRCDRRKAEASTVRALREPFKKLIAVHLTKADGALNGTFHLVFDQGGLFILSGVIVMLPESRIIEDAKRGSVEDANNLQDAAREVGNLLVGSWDRIFREDCPGHRHFVKTGTFIGKPWDKPEQIELQANTEVVAVVYEMTIDPYPSFMCAAVFPCAVLDGFGADEPTGTEPAPTETPVAASEPSGKPARAPEPAPVPRPPEPVKSAKPAPEPSQVAEAPRPKKSAETPKPKEDAAAPEPQKSSDSSPATQVPDSGPHVAVPQPPADRLSATRPASGQGADVLPSSQRSPLVDGGMLPSELASARSVGSGAVVPSAGFTFLDAAYIQSQPQAALAELLGMSAAEIMEKEVVWAGPEETVQDVIAKMQQHNVGYVLIGVNGVLEGLVSSSNVLGAVSLYLRPMFAKWHRPQDDATLGVKVKWVMSRPVRTIRPDATLAAMIETMRRCGGRCLPVVDAKGAVQGIVTVFDILLRVSESDKSISFKGRPPQAPALLI